MKTLSFIGIVLFSLMLLASWSTISDLSSDLSDFESLGGWASLLSSDLGDALTEFSGNVYGICGLALISSFAGLILSVIVLIKTCVNKDRKPKSDVNQQLLQLGYLRDKGILSEDEFEAEKRKLMI